MNLILTAIVVGNLLVTSYRSVPNQTDSSPYNTATGERTSMSGVAVSQDLLCGACLKKHRRCDHPELPDKVHYGDLLYIQDVGFRIANDCMGKYQHYRVLTKNGTRIIQTKQLRWLDVFVDKLEDEQAFHKKHGITRHEVWKVAGALK